MKNLLNLSKAILLLSILFFCGEEAFGQQKTDTAKTLELRRLGPIVYPNYGMHIEWMPDGEHYIHMEWNCEKDRNNCIPEGFWDKALQQLGDKLKTGEPCQGLCQAIHLIGEQLSAFFPADKEENNELSNEIIYED